MHVRYFAWLVLGCVMLTSCDHTAVTPPANQGAAVTQSLPGTIASPPETLNLPRRFPGVPPIRAGWRHGNVDVSSNASGWHGRIVSVYYVPLQNTGYERGNHVLRSTVGIQKVAMTTIRPDGSWSTTWDTKGQKLPGDRIFLLIHTDAGQAGLIQLPRRG